MKGLETMKIARKTLLLLVSLLAAALLLAACGNAPAEPETPAEPTIVASWEGDVDLTGFLEGLYSYGDVIFPFDPIVGKLSFTFRDDGTFERAATIDPSYKETLRKGLLAAVDDYYKAFLDDENADTEAFIVEELGYDSTEDYVDHLVAGMDLTAALGAIDMAGASRFDGSRLDMEKTAADFGKNGYTVAVLTADTLTLSSVEDYIPDEEVYDSYKDFVTRFMPITLQKK